MTYVDSLIQRFKSKGLLVDTNLMVLSIVGGFDNTLIGPDGFKRTRSYTTDDFELLGLFLEEFQTIVTTAHVLTEVSNLIGQLFGEKKSRCFEDLRGHIDRVIELPVVGSVAAKRPEFLFLGLTDCVLAELATDYLILTDDARCAKILNEAGLDALNFTNLRSYLF
jgi:hypothetical protein